MKYIYKQRVKIIGEFYTGQTGTCLVFAQAKDKKEDPNEVPYNMYNVRLDGEPVNTVWIKEDLLEALNEVPTAEVPAVV